MFFKTFLYCLTLLPLGVLAALDEKVKLANRTIDRVSELLRGRGREVAGGVHETRQDVFGMEGREHG